MKSVLATVAVLLCLPLSASPQASAPAAAESADARRERAQKIAAVVQALALEEGGHVADIGAGDGLYEISLSRAAGASGRVYAEDIDEKGAIKQLHERVAGAHLANVEVILGTPDDPKLPAATLDGVLMVITYHEVADYRKMLEHVFAALKPGGRLVVVDMMPHKTLARPRADQTKNHVIAAALAESEIREAGFEVLSRDDHFIDNPDEESTRWMIVFRKPAPLP
ncbi:MAG: methyltransferase domain-containing protein [Acidobacteriia bacterium]|nr:methyltransferase domain-containing protein [Terriglobia bacterium]